MNALEDVRPRPDPEPEGFCDEDEGSGGGTGSLKTEIFELEATAVPLADVAASRFDFPGCLIVDPAIFFSSGTFSLILVFRVPRSPHSFMLLLAARSADCASSPVGSTNICRRLLFCDAREADEADAITLADDTKADCVDEDVDV